MRRCGGRSPLFFAVFACCCCYWFGAICAAKFCGNVDVRGNVTDFKRLEGCKVVSGYLQVVLFDKATVETFRNFSFPELEEVTGYFLIYQVPGLLNLGKMFPNLKIVRGMEVISNYAFILFNLYDLQEIGLTNLQYVGNGIRIENCPKLCFVNTVNWTQISSTDIKFTPSPDHAKCEVHCPHHCNGFCWNGHECQKCASPSQMSPDCKFCETNLDGDVCVKECPKNKYNWISRCVTYEECTSIPDKDMFIIDGRNCTHTCPKRYQMKYENTRKYCEYCGDKCLKFCNGTVVENMNILKSLEGCTHINGSLIITLGKTAAATQEVLGYNLEEIRVITGELRIQRTDQIESLDFLRGLKEIRGEKTHSFHKYVMTIRDNADLTRLFNWTVTDLYLGPGNISFHYNPMLCFSEIEEFANRTNKNDSFEDIHISKLSNGDQAACSKRDDLNVRVLNKNATFITLKWDDAHVDKKDLIGYFVYYKETNSCKDNKDVSRDNCDIQDWSRQVVTETTVNLTNLNSFTSYFYYIKILSNKSNSETPVMCFRSSANDPSPPLDVILKPVSSDTITLSWKPPESPNGHLTHYRLFGFRQDDDRTLLDSRNYCERGISSEFEVQKPHGHLEGEEANGTCNCNDYINLNTKTLEKLCYYHDSLGMDLSGSCNDYKVEIINLPADNRSAERKDAGASLVNLERKQMDVTIDADLTEYNITDLYHYTPYVFYFSACNTEDGISHCSAIIMDFGRTLSRDGADDIDDINVEVDKNNTYVSWHEPKAPNGVIVSYNLIYGLADSAGIKKQCITRAGHAESHYTYVIEGLGPGKYEIKVQAESLAGEGKFTEIKIFSISSNNNDIIISVVVILCCLTILGAACFYVRYRKKRELESMHLIPTINPDYAGPNYIADEWEMERDNVEIQKELGQGTFGMVCKGFIKSQGIPCAVKTVNKNSNMHDRLEFLNEASVMKSFNDAHHVVKLLGVVSKGQPPLVIMELMERGDLKRYLLRSRESSHNITCVEMYRMAAEIADGMAYLAAKKFVHRDLAARNCMVSADYTVKIGDFGMARDIYETDYYKKESKGLFPVRWMAPESLTDGVFTSDSDAWSYGVVLWEIVTLAEQPYQGLSNEQVFQFVAARGTLDRPADCPDLLFEIMQVCWKWKPYDRPLFMDMVEKLESHIRQDFRLVSFYHSREGEEYRLNDRERVYNYPAMPMQGEKFALWKTSDEEVSLYSGNGDRPSEFLSFSLQRHSRPSSSFQMEPGTSSHSRYDDSPRI